MASCSGLVVRVVESDSSDFAVLVSALDAELEERYPGLGEDEPSPAEDLVVAVVAYIDRVPVGCGALRRLELGVVEVKRMFVAPEARRHGAARRMLEALEAEARACGYGTVRLGSGIRQPEALALYESSGYRRVPPFGEYEGSGLCVCYEKALEPWGDPSDPPIRQDGRPPVIRSAVTDDFEAIVDIWLAASCESHRFVPCGFWQSQVIAMRDVYLPGSESYVATDTAGRVIGFASLAGGELAALFVEPSSQGRGIGSSLLKYAQALRDTLTLSVYTSNHRAYDFYHRHGFRASEERIDERVGERETCMRWDVTA